MEKHRKLMDSLLVHTMTEAEQKQLAVLLDKVLKNLSTIPADLNF